MYEEMRALIREYDTADMPTHAIVPPGPDLRALEKAFPNGEVAGIKIIVSDRVPPGTAYLIVDPPKEATPAELDSWWHKLPIYSQRIINLAVP